MASLNLFVEISRPQLHSLKFYRAQEEEKSARNEYVYSECTESAPAFQGPHTINLLAGPRGPWSSARIVAPRLGARCMPPRGTAAGPSGGNASGARSGRADEVGSRSPRVYTTFASAPVWFKAVSGIYWWALHYKKRLIRHCLPFIMMPSKVNCTHAICNELIQQR